MSAQRMKPATRLKEFLRVVSTYSSIYNSYCCEQLESAIGHAKRKSWDAVALCLGRAAEQLFAMALDRTATNTKWRNIISLRKAYDACSIRIGLTTGKIDDELAWVRKFSKQRNAAAHGTKPVPKTIDEQFIKDMLDDFGELLEGELFKSVRDRAWK